MLSIIGFLAILGPLVVVHEFGHFFFARLFGVKAEVFSIGFGPKIWGRKWGETDFRVSIVPLGGYVKLLGEEPNAEMPESEKARSLTRQEPWKRFLIFFGGPLFNFLFAILVFMSILVIGEPQVANVLGRVIPQTAAYEAGFRTGDRVVTLDGNPIRTYRDMVMAIYEKPFQKMVAIVERPGADQSKTISFVPTESDGYSMYGEEKKVGQLDGMMSAARDTRFGVSDPKSIAGLGGLITGEKIKSVGGVNVASWAEAEERYASLPSGAVVLEVSNEEKARSMTFKKPERSLGMDRDWGLYSSELFVQKVVEESPALTAGILKGDRLVSINGKTTVSFFHLKELIQEFSKKEGKVKVGIERAGVKKVFDIVPVSTQERDPSLRKSTIFTIGVAPLLGFAEPVTVVERVWNPFVLVYRGTARMLDFTWRNMVSLGKMLTGEVSVKTLGGPILIGKIAGDSLSRGLVSFLTAMAILSVGLGFLNILPIPVLDGGHLLLLVLEIVRGKALSIRQMEIVQQVGLSMILLLMVVVMRNDLSRLPIFNN